jgi:tellurite resistance protein TehA-like permease
VTAAVAEPRRRAPPSDDGLRTLHPAYFAMVMATGIVSIAGRLVGVPLVAPLLFALNNVLYVTLWILVVLRVLRFRDAVRSDLLHHGRAVGFFTMVAGTCVLGSQWLVVGGRWDVAAALWVVGVALWALLTYGILTVLTVVREKPPLEEGLNGGWLVAVVAGQSVAVLGAQLAAGFGTRAPDVLLFCLVMWLGSGMLYVWIISLIFYRYTFFPMDPSHLTPPYWINMGAVAISTLAGAMLLAAAPHSPLVTALLPFVQGLTLLFWATATWWIPMLLLLGVWRHVQRRFPLRYDPLYWGAVFPLGMYTACTVRLSQVLDVPSLAVIPRVSVWVALAAWTATMAGLVRRLVGR